MQDTPKAVWCIPYVSVAFFPSLKHNFIAYPSSKVSDCIFEIYLLWQSGFCRVYSNSCCSRSFEPEIIKVGQSTHKMYSNNLVNFQESMTILSAGTKKVWKLIEGTTYINNPSYHSRNFCKKPRSNTLVCRVYSNSCCSSWFKPEIIKIGHSSHKMNSNNQLNFQKSTTILNACTKKSGNLSYAPRTHISNLYYL